MGFCCFVVGVVSVCVLVLVVFFFTVDCSALGKCMIYKIISDGGKVSRKFCVFSV